MQFSDVKCTIIQSQLQLSECLLWFLQQKTPIGFDLETTGTNHRKGDVVVGIGVASATEGYYLPLIAYDPITKTTSRITPVEWQQLLLQACEGKQLIAWNGAFEAAFCEHTLSWDFVKHFYAEIMVMLHVCDENRFHYGLKENSEREFGAVAVQAQADMLASMKANGGSDYEYYKADVTPLGIYCIWDCALTVRWHDKLLPQLIADGLHDFFFKHESMPLYKEVTIPMEQHGVRVDVELLQQSLAAINLDIGQLENEIQSAIEPHLGPFKQWFLNNHYPPARSGDFAQSICKLAGFDLPTTATGKLSITAKNVEGLPDGHFKAVLQQREYLTTDEALACQLQLWAAEGKQYMFNLSSKDHLKRLFFTALKETPLSKTPKGAPQVDDEFLDLMAKKHSWAEQLRTYNRLIKLRGTYIERFLDRHENGQFYPQWKQHGTVTGRYSGDLQQLPRIIEPGDAPEIVRKHTNNIRNFFIANEGCVLIDADYESLEPHVFAHISRDPALIEIFNAGLDFYSTIAIKTERIAGVSADKKAPNYLGKVAKSTRQRAKAYALGIAYGEEDYKLHLELGIEQSEAKKLVDGYWAGFPVLRQQSDNGKYQILQHGWIATEFGRRRRLKEAQWIAAKYGTGILDSLELWKQYNHQPAIYADMKQARKRLKRSLNAAINYPTQGGSSSIVNRAAIALARQLKAEGVEATIIANIHDELLLSAKLGHEQAAARIQKKCMENTTHLSVQLKAEPVIGQRYGEIK